MLSSVSLKANAVTTAHSLSNPTATGEDALVDDSLVVGLEDVEILATRVPLTQMQAPRQVTVLHAVDIAAAAVHSINDLLEYAAGVDVRQRGDLGVQTDISVRGGTFDQMTLLLNGINISSPHTGHLSADFPISVQDIERIEVVQGPAARVFGTSAFTGAINVVTRTLPEGSDRLSGQAHVYGGSYGYAGADASLSHYSAIGQTGSYGGTGTLGYSRSDGATSNSNFESTRAFYRGQYRQGETQVNLQLGYSYKPYGANTFYGAASRDQWESNERYMGALTAQFRLGRWHLSPAV
ncbi:MAG: TonB-dependent receptor plug domain-containing protein, partial [Bacteroidales bacterium]|nr:TonB-dependent receptor plug domain-containing protein [Bacteroidales bacterium]